MIKRILLALIFVVCASVPARAQLGPSTNGPMWNPNWYQGYDPTSREWGLMWSNKMDYFAAGLPVVYGGTGATTATQARTNLGALGNALPSGQIYVGSSANVATPRAMSGDCTLTNTAVITCTATAAASIAAGASGTTITGTTNANGLLYNANTNRVTNLASAANGVLVTSAGSVPSISSTLPSGLTIPAPLLTGSVSIGTITLGDDGNNELLLGSGQYVGFSPTGGIVFNNGLGPIFASDSYTDGTATVTGKSVSGITGNVASGSPTISSVSPNPITAGVLAGDPVLGTGILVGTTVLSRTSNSITLSQNATATNTGVSLAFRYDTNFTVQPAAAGGGAYISLNAQSGANEERLIMGGNTTSGYVFGQVITGSGTYRDVTFEANPNAVAWVMATDAAGTYARFRLPNNQGLYARNAANNADLDIMRVNTSNQLVLGTDTSATLVPTLTNTNGLIYNSGSSVLANLATANSGVLVTSSGGVPSVGTRTAYVLENSGYSTLAAAVAGIGSTPAELVIGANYTLTASVTIPSTMKLTILKGGGITKASSFTLTVNGVFEAPPVQVFTGFSSGDVTFAAGPTPIIRVEWWGAVAGGVTATNTTAINNALKAGMGGPAVRIGQGTFTVAGTGSPSASNGAALIINDINNPSQLPVDFCGVGTENTIIAVADNNYFNVMEVVDTSNTFKSLPLTLCDMTLAGNGANNEQQPTSGGSGGDRYQNGLYAQTMQGLRLVNVNFKTASYHGLALNAVQYSFASGVRTYSNYSLGVLLTGDGGSSKYGLYNQFDFTADNNGHYDVTHAVDTNGTGCALIYQRYSDIRCVTANNIGPPTAGSETASPVPGGMYLAHLIGNTIRLVSQNDYVGLYFDGGTTNNIIDATITTPISTGILDYNSTASDISGNEVRFNITNAGVNATNLGNTAHGSATGYFRNNHLFGVQTNIDNAVAQPLNLIGTYYRANVFGPGTAADQVGNSKISYFVSAVAPDGGNNIWHGWTGNGTAFTSGVSTGLAASNVAFGNLGVLSTFITTGTGSLVAYGGALGTPSSGNGSNITSVNAASLGGKVTGTSGNTIPLLDGTNTWTNSQIINGVQYGAYTTGASFGGDGSNVAIRPPVSGGIYLQSSAGSSWALFDSTNLQLLVPLTYGGVTAANSVTGTGSLMLNASPTVTGTLTVPNIASPAATNMIIDVPASQAWLVSEGSTNKIQYFNGVFAASTSTAVSLGSSGALWGGLWVNLASDAATTNNTVCALSTGEFRKGSGTLGICLGTSTADAKHDIFTVRGGLDRIADLRPVGYKYNGGDERTLYGFIAEEVAVAMPEVVARDSSGKPNSVDMVGMIPFMVNALRELQAVNDNLREEVAKLKTASGKR